MGVDLIIIAERVCALLSCWFVFLYSKVSRDKVPDETRSQLDLDYNHDGSHPAGCVLLSEGPGLEVGHILGVRLRQLH